MCGEAFFFPFFVLFKFERRKGLPILVFYALSETSETTGVSLTTSQDKTGRLLNRWFHHEQDLRSTLEEVVWVLLKLDMGKKIGLRNPKEAVLSNHTRRWKMMFLAWMSTIQEYGVLQTLNPRHSLLWKDHSWVGFIRCVYIHCPETSSTT